MPAPEPAPATHSLLYSPALIPPILPAPPPLMSPRSEWSRTIYARGRDEDYLIMTRGRLLDRIRVMLAGRAAEEVVQGTPSSYSNGDLSVSHSGSGEPRSRVLLGWMLGGRLGSRKGEGRRGRERNAAVVGRRKGRS